jgi:predicted nucleotidyltransferase
MSALDTTILTIGTQVVALVETRGPNGKPVHPRGAVGVITQAPGDHLHSYRVRFIDGFEAALKGGDIAILSKFQDDRAGLASNATDTDLRNAIIYRCIVGSRAYGLDTDASDIDRRGIYLPPAERHWSLFGVPEQLENPDAEEVYWELQKFLTLALKANPNVLECLYTPIVEHATPLAQELLSMRDVFLSKLVYQTYNGYVASQFRKIQADLRNKGSVKWKHVMHLIRLLLAGITTLAEGAVPVHVGEHRDALLKIRRGETAFDAIDAWRVVLHRQFDEAFEKTKLPDRPDYAAVNALLIRARKGAVAP